ncbi:MAG: biosynthesis protein WbpP [Phycisphaerales bacterium]|nr:biosynthesis protein WbpP [Phycisphaerales bacterium]
MPDRQQVLVTGGAGFIGSHIVHALVGRGHSVRVLDDLRGSGSWRRLEDLGDKIERIVGDVCDPAVVAKTCAGVQLIFHKAALVSVPESVSRPADYHAVDATATLRLLIAARDAGVKRVVYASTSAIYGDAPEQPKVESMRGLPLSPYGIAKYTGELYMTAFAVLYGMENISLRYFNVFGPGQDPKSQYGAAVPGIVTRVLTDQPPTIYGDGEQTRDFCHVSNIVHANMLAADAPKLAGEVVNIGCGRRVTVNRIVELANQLLGKQVKPNHEPARPGDVRDSLADISLARSVLGYEPIKHFDEGLADSIDWYVKHRAK